MSGVVVALSVALGAVIVIVLAEHLTIWSLFWNRGWRVMVPVQKGYRKEDTQSAAAEPVAAAGPKPVRGGRAA